MLSPSTEEQDSCRPQVRDSHERARHYGLDPTRAIPVGQPHLSPEALSKRRKASCEFLDAASVYIQELQRTIKDVGFAVAVTDKDGYLLDLAGDSAALKDLGEYILGSRWTERDVGTSAISLALRHEKPFQITASEHFREQSQGNTCSAAPIFDQQGKLIGVIAVTGEAEKVHPHTLGMLITAARAIENHMRMSRASQELLLNNDFLRGVIESIDSGVMAVDKKGNIIQINDRGKQILKHKEIEGRPLSILKSTREDWHDVIATGKGYRDREVFIKTPQETIQIIATAKLIIDASGQPEGVIFVFNEINRIRKLVNRMAGAQASFTFGDIVGTSPAIQEAKRFAMIAAAGKSSVLLHGETGTGKELFAQSIHNQSQRKNHPFMAINCGAIPHELLESELFGYVEGAFTGAKSGGRPGKFELADGGTVFLDEVCDMHADMQVKLLRALQSGEVFRIGQSRPISVDMRIIASSQYDLREQVARGSFREDLFYRLDVLPIEIPPLRERGADILLLANHFLARWCEIMKKPVMSFSTASNRILSSYHWPGNVRELQNLVERAVNFSSGSVIEPVQFGLSLLEKKPATENFFCRNRLEIAEKQTILEALVETNYNIARAAHTLGTTRTTLYKRLKKYSLKVPDRNV